ncbi:SDR family oxidoreductase [Methylobacterium sp. R2-1]|uniref:SDR family oxidoreductase n=1 Tax=Methylobacterium sp. R2-1 TaxID=2587064 RepID=UPI001616810A|nr:SDR family oxidoreductase [Methylobacterium sp. R2-1]MBB2964260.1 NAD(P)-dependent dehydrogenase (short-subunit alcohol dehydrogenase family) [Methylobacterium sp. R2-1]
MDIKDRVAFVTGANGGIGSALVSELLRRGVRRVYAASRSPRGVKPGTAEASGLLAVQLDVVDSSGVIAAARLAHDVTLLFNNAGSMTRGPLLNTSLADVRGDMETNFFGTLQMIRAFAGVIERNGGGGIVNILSVSAWASSPDAGGYSASKAAAHSLTQSLRAELGPRGIAVLAAYPGPVNTDMTRDFEIPKANPHEVARLIVDGVEDDQEDIVPDRMSRQAADAWRRDPKVLERQFAALYAADAR